MASECLVEGDTTSATEVSGGYMLSLCLLLGEIKLK